MKTIERVGRVLGRPQPLRLLARRAAYELERKVSRSAESRDRIVPYGDSLRIHARLTDEIEREVYFTAEWDPITQAVLSRLVEKGMTVADVGAHVGTITLAASRLVGPGGQVLAFEPNPQNHARLRENLELNRITNVRLFPVALSDRDGVAELAVPEGNSGWGAIEHEVATRRAAASGWTAEVSTRRLDGILAESPGASLDVMKVDVEGAETMVLRGGQDTLRRDRPIVVFEVLEFRLSGGLVTSEPSEMLLDLGYELFAMAAERNARVPLVRLRPGVDPRRYQQASQALSLVAIHPAAARQTRTWLA